MEWILTISSKRTGERSVTSSGSSDSRNQFIFSFTHLLLLFLIISHSQHGDVYTFILLGRSVTVALGSKGSNLILNGKLSQVSAEEAYTHLTTPVFGKEVVYDVPNSVLMEQKKFVKVGLSTDNMKVYVDQITDELQSFIKTDPKFKSFNSTTTKNGGISSSVDIFKSMCEITILTASRTLQGREVREGLDKSFADLYHDLDSGFTPINFVIPNLPLPNNFKRDRAQKKMSDFYREIVKRRREEGVLDVSINRREEREGEVTLDQEGNKFGSFGDEEVDLSN